MAMTRGLPLCGELVVARPVDPHRTGAVDLVGPDGADFSRPHARVPLEQHHRPHDRVQVWQDRLDGLPLDRGHWLRLGGGARPRFQTLHGRERAADRFGDQFLGDGPLERPDDPPDAGRPRRATACLARRSRGGRSLRL